MRIEVTIEIEQHPDNDHVLWIAKAKSPTIKYPCDALGYTYPFVRRKVQVMALERLAELVHRQEIVDIEEIKFIIAPPKEKMTGFDRSPEMRLRKAADLIATARGDTTTDAAQRQLREALAMIRQVTKEVEGVIHPDENSND